MSQESQLYLKKLKSDLKSRDLLHIIDLLPSTASLPAHEDSFHGDRTIRLYFGARQQADGVPVSLICYVMISHNDMTPPIVFRNQLPTVSSRTGINSMFPLSSLSILRKATRPVVPCCFLQFNPLADDTVGGGNMLCAVISYYVLASGPSEIATQ